MQKLLRIETSYFVAGAIWEKKSSGNWECTKAAPIIKWMVGKSPKQIAKYIRAKKWRWQWI